MYLGGSFLSCVLARSFGEFWLPVHVRNMKAWFGLKQKKKGGDPPLVISCGYLG